MSAKAVPIASNDPQVTIWDRFLRLADDRVRECNAVAGERIWLAAVSGNSPDSWSVHSAARPGDSVSCRFDVQSGVLVCQPGSALRGETLVLECAGMLDLLRCGEVELTLEQAVDLILNRLEWPDDPCDTGQFENEG